MLWLASAATATLRAALGRCKSDHGRVDVLALQEPGLSGPFRNTRSAECGSAVSPVRGCAAQFRSNVARPAARFRINVCDPWFRGDRRRRSKVSHAHGLRQMPPRRPLAEAIAVTSSRGRCDGPMPPRRPLLPEDARRLPEAAAAASARGRPGAVRARHPFPLLPVTHKIRISRLNWLGCDAVIPLGDHKRRLIARYP